MTYIWFRALNLGNKGVHLLFLEAGHRTDVVGLEVVNHRPQTLDPFLHTSRHTHSGHTDQTKAHIQFTVQSS